MTLASFDLKGILDNATDYVDNIVPLDTPFYNALRKVAHRTNRFDWVTDTNDGDVLGHTLGANVAGGRLELRDVDSVPTNDSENLAIGNQELVTNYCQIFRKFVKISKSAAATTVHGRVSETQYQIDKAITALKNQIEGTFISGQTGTAHTASVPARTAGITAQVPTYMFASDASDAGVAELANKLFQNGSNADTIYANRKAMGALKNLMDVGSGVGPKLQWEEGGKDWMTFTDINGRLYKLIAHRHLDEISGDNIVAIFLNTSDWSCVVFRDWKVEKLDTRGSYDEYMISCEVGLRNDAKYKTGVLAAAPTPSPAPPAPTAAPKAAKSAK